MGSSKIMNSYEGSSNPGNSFDVVLIGSGHNGLITAAYLARAGYRVCVLERQQSIGGAVCTETMFRSDRFPGGFRIDVGSSVHIMIHQTGILEELELDRYGLEYVEMDPIMSYPMPDGNGVIHFFQDVDRTLESIARVAPEDVENYRRFVDYWGKVNRSVFKAFMKPPTGRGMGWELLKSRIRGEKMFGETGQIDGIRSVLSSYGKVVEDSFENPWLKTAMIWFAAQSGPTPDMTATADFAGWQAMLHQSGAKHPKGGSGALTQALAKLIEEHGGVIRTGEPVASIEIEEGRARGVLTRSNEWIKADLVVSNAHVQTTMLQLVGREHLKDSMLQSVENINIGNGFGMVIRCAVEELPRYTASPEDPFIHNGMQLLAPSRQYLEDAIADYYRKQPPEQPAVLAMTFSKIDPDVAPSGGHTLFAWAQWHPYELRDGGSWDEIREREADKIYEVVCRYAPNMEGKLIERYIQTPLDIERRHGMLRGNVMHLEMTLDQMFMFRPTPELSRYETPIKNLYLSSASCHPGGGVFGAAGYNAAHVILDRFGAKR